MAVRGQGQDDVSKAELDRAAANRNASMWAPSLQRATIVNVYTTFPWSALCAEVAKLRYCGKLVCQPSPRDR
jgi:hypothetical protein